MAKFISIESVSIVPVPGSSVKINREGNIIGCNLPGFIVLFKSSFRRGFQKIFRKSHISDDDLRSFDSFLIKRILPEIKAYRKQYLERDVPQGESDDEKKEWLAVIDEIIFSFRWRLEVDILFDPPKKIAFYKEYYGQYISFEDDKDKHFEQYADSSRRASKSFELFGKFFVRKSDVPDYDLINLNISIAKRVLPKIKAYREIFLKKNKNLNGLNNGPYASLQEYLSDEDKERIADISDVENELSDGAKAFFGADEEKRWLMTIDEIIYAMRWCLEADKDKLNEQYDDSLYRAKRGFMSFGYFLSNCSGKL